MAIDGVTCEVLRVSSLVWPLRQSVQVVCAPGTHSQLLGSGGQIAWLKEDFVNRLLAPP